MGSVIQAKHLCSVRYFSGPESEFDTLSRKVLSPILTLQTLKLSGRFCRWSVTSAVGYLRHVRWEIMWLWVGLRVSGFRFLVFGVERL